MIIKGEALKKLNSRDILSSVDIMNADKIENQNVLTSFDLFHRMPGVQIAQFNQGTTTGKLFFRGFNGKVAGLTGRWIVFISGFVPIILFVTGLIRWWQKRF